MLAAARQTAVHTAAPETATALLDETSTTSTSAASALRVAGGEMAILPTTGVGASARAAVAESLSVLGRTEGAGGSLAGQSLLATEESLMTLRDDVSNAFQSGIEDVLDHNADLESVTEQVRTLLPTFEVATQSAAST